MKPKFLLLICLLPSLSTCQSISIKGNVINEQGNPIPAATITIKGTDNATVADSKGAFILFGTSPNDSLLVSATGYQSTTELSNMRGLITVILKRNAMPLKVGDTMPDIALSNIINFPVSKIQLSQFKGKLIILDFWGRYCRSCIATFPKLDSLRALYKDQVQIITISDFENKEDLKATLAKYPFTKNLKLTASTHHEELASLFPHELVSHVVWINSKGIVAAITGADYVTSEHIRELLQNDVVHWPVKKDRLEFNYRQPLLALGQKDLPVPEFLYYSTLTANMPGVSAPNGTIRDSSKGIAMTLYYNASLLSLCEIALNHPPDSLLILDVKDASRFKWTNQTLYSDWFRANTYCYALVLPNHLSKTAIKEAVRADLLRWLNVLGVQITTSKKMEAGKEQTIYTISIRE